MTGRFAAGWALSVAGLGPAIVIIAAVPLPRIAAVLFLCGLLGGSGIALLRCSRRG